LDAAQEKGVILVELEYMEGNERGRRLYEKFGFKIVAEKPNTYRLRDGSMRGEIHMQKYL
jgi:ribosomal protein S18 acetylase RimI-like enzyme